MAIQTATAATMPSVALTAGQRVLVLAARRDEASDSGDAPVVPRPAIASRNSAGDAKRSAGSFSSARLIAASTCTGTLERDARALGAFSVSTLAMIACAVPATYGGSPTSISNVIAPSE